MMSVLLAEGTTGTPKGAEPVLLGSRFRYQPDTWNPALDPRQVAACRGAEREMDRGELVFETVGCLCGERSGELIATRDWFGFYYPIRLCGRCGLLRQEVRMTAPSLARFYEKWYRAIYEVPNPGGVDAELAARIEIGKQRFKEIVASVSLEQGSTVVDIGCNYGHLLAPFRDAGMNVWGCDFGAEHLEIGRERFALPQLVIGDARTLTARGVRAELILLDHVFEHFTDPVGELRRIGELLSPGGRVFVVVPGTWWWTRHECSGDFLSLLQNAHAFQYDLRTLTETFARAGFVMEKGDERVVAVFRRGTSPSNLDSANPGRDVHRLLKMERRRQVRVWGRDLLRATGLGDAAKRLRRMLR